MVSNDEGPSKDSVRARFAGTCAGCQGPIAQGEVITRTLTGWAHVEHDRQDLDRKMPGATRTAIGYQVTCPRCGALPEASCTTDAGHKSPVHAPRRDRQLEVGLIPPRSETTPNVSGGGGF